MNGRIILKFILIAVLSVSIGLVARNALYKSNDMVKVVIAERDIDAYEVFDPSNVQFVYVPKEFRDDFLKESVDDPKYILGGVALKSYHAGEVIMLNDQEISPVYAAVNDFITSDELDADNFVPKGFRLESVEIDRSGSVNSQLSAGDFVDVIYTSSSTKTGGSYSRLIISHVQIQNVEVTKDDECYVTLILSPKNAVALASAKRNGTVDLVLNPANYEYEYVSPIFTGAFANEKDIKPNYEVIIRDLMTYLYSNNELREQLPVLLPEDLTYSELINELAKLELTNQNNLELEVVIGGEKDD